MSTATMQAITPEFRAAGTDLSERRRTGVSKGPVIDLVLPGDDGIIWGANGAATLGAFATIATIAADTRIKDAYPGVAATDPDAKQGWLAGLLDPAVGKALAGMHRQPQSPWTLDSLAKRAGA